MTRAMLFLMLTAAAISAAAPARARTALGVFEGWAAVRDDRPRRCYAIAEPRGGSGAYATVAVRGGLSTVHFRLRRARLPQSPVLLAIDGRKYRLLGGRIDAWAADARADAAIVQAMRGDGWMWITAQAPNGRFFTDGYALSGAASAIDAARLGCARLR
jgi:hypothetical protein